MINKYLIFHILLVISIAFIVLNAFHYLNSFNRNISIDSLAYNRYEILILIVFYFKLIVIKILFNLSIIF
jgi:hypothetical protein